MPRPFSGGTRQPATRFGGPLVGRLSRVLPRGRLLPDDVWQQRHRVITILALLHTPAVLAFGVLTGHEIGHVITEALPVAAFAFGATQERLGRLLRSISASLSLLTASAILVHLSNGTIELHFHFFVVVPLLALYQDWIPFLLSVGYVVAHHLTVGLLDPASVFNHPAGHSQPLVWALIHGLYIAALSVVSLVGWSMSRLAFSDPLTNLASRSLFRSRLDHANQTAARSGLTPAVLFIDIDDFKTVNDSLGHAAGDDLLTEVGHRIRRALRSEDTAARMGGDEFAILLENATVEAATQLADRVLLLLRNPFAIGAHTLPIRISIGISVAGLTSAPADMLRDADTAMYAAKAAGKDRYAVFEPRMHEAAVTRLQLKTDLERAVARDELTIDYQPVFDIGTGAPTGVEALLRWRHAERGMVPPLEFIPLAEETDLIVEIGRRVLKRACDQAAAWGTLIPNLSVYVNLSMRQLCHPRLVADVTDALERSGLLPDRLVLEITESGLMEEVERSMRSMEALKALGVRLAIDDFGTGHSSLSYLRQLPVDILKIDRSFIDELRGGVGDKTIAGVIVSLGRTLGLHVIAEGVEESAQLTALRAGGCDAAQGYFLARPMPPDGMHEFLAARRSSAVNGTGHAN
jgi:diguanylate cyclase